MPDSFMRPLKGSALPIDKHQPIGAVDPDDVVEALVKVKRQSRDGWPSHEEFLAGARLHVSREQLAERHGADPAAISAISKWASSSGLAVGRTDAASRSIHLIGAASAMEKAFGVALKSYRHSETGDSFRAHDGAVHAPAEIADFVAAVFGLDTFPLALPHWIASPDLRPARFPDDSAGPLRSQFPGSFLPNEAAKLYDFPSAKGAGQKVAILEFGGGFSQTTLDNYFANILGLAKTPSVNAISILGATQDIDSPATSEVYLDIDVVGGMAPEAEIDVYFAPFTGAGYLAAIEKAIRNFDYAAISISWGIDEDLSQWTMLHDMVDEAFQDAVALGIPIFVSAGDNGDGNRRLRLPSIGEVSARTKVGHVSYPASSPYATACGGTLLYAENGAVTREVVWNEQTGPFHSQAAPFPFYVGGATGGGVSDRYTKVPSYQSGAGLEPQSVNPGAGVGRGVPDVAGNAGASTGYLVSYPPGSAFPTAPAGGTSAVAPMWAALMACAREELDNEFDGQVPKFFFNDFIYAVGKTDAFRDVVGGREFAMNHATGRREPGAFTPTGNNRNSEADGYYSAQGYDLCTGLGSPHGKNLLKHLKAWLASRA